MVVPLWLYPETLISWLCLWFTLKHWYHACASDLPWNNSIMLVPLIYPETLIACVRVPLIYSETLISCVCLWFTVKHWYHVCASDLPWIIDIMLVPLYLYPETLISCLCLRLSWNTDIMYGLWFTVKHWYHVCASVFIPWNTGIMLVPRYYHETLISFLCLWFTVKHLYHACASVFIPWNTDIMIVPLYYPETLISCLCLCIIMKH